MKTVISIFLIVPVLMFLSGRSFSQSVSAAPSAIQPGGEITVNWSGAPGNATDWIGLYPESAPSDRSWLTWKYTNGVRSGSMTFNAPEKPGRYNFRLFENDGYKLLSAGNTVVVQTAPPPPPPPPAGGQATLSNPGYVTPGGTISVSFTGAPGNPTDWIAIYPESAPSDRSWLTWKYTNGARSGNLSFTAPSAPGRYNFRMLENDGYKLLATGTTFIVQTAPPPPPPVPAGPYVTNPAYAKPGETVTVTYAGAPGYKTDWIGLYPKSAPSDRSWLSWKYTEGAKSGQMTFTAPQTPGEYNFRLFENDGYKLLYTGNTLTVR